MHLFALPKFRILFRIVFSSDKLFAAAIRTANRDIMRSQDYHDFAFTACYSTTLLNVDQRLRHRRSTDCLHLFQISVAGVNRVMSDTNRSQLDLFTAKLFCRLRLDIVCKRSDSVCVSIYWSLFTCIWSTPYAFHFSTGLLGRQTLVGGIWLWAASMMVIDIDVQTTRHFQRRQILNLRKSQCSSHGLCTTSSAVPSSDHWLISTMSHAGLESLTMTPWRGGSIVLVGRFWRKYHFHNWNACRLFCSKFQWNIEYQILQSGASPVATPCGAVALKSPNESMEIGSRTIRPLHHLTAICHRVDISSRLSSSATESDLWALLVVLYRLVFTW